MDLKKEIELALEPKDTQVVGQEDDILADSVLELANSDFTKQDDYEDVTPGTIRKHVEADMRVAYPGKPTSRKLMYSKDNAEMQLTKNESDSNTEEELTSDEADSDVSSQNNDMPSMKSGFQEDDNGSDSSDFGGSITGFENDSRLCQEETNEVKTEDDHGIDIFSAKARDLKFDIEKGKSIRNQLTIWEKLIECRIKLQPGLICINKLFQCEALEQFKSHLNTEDEETVYQTYSVLSDLMKRLLELQELTLNASPEYKELKNFKRKNNDTKNQEPEEKRKRSPDFLQDIYEDFKPFKDVVIQKWNEKTRLSHGRISKSDFSAFDQPTLKQIEEILLDRERLLKRTRTKRTDYKVLGKTSDGDSSKVKNLQEYDPEIFDDDDFYHKLLRDFIENKTSDASDFSKRGKQWLELQKLRSRMKAKVDTRASKGRKIRYTVHNKMVNFMAPVPLFSWSDEAKNELFKSVFGQVLKQKG